MLVDPYGAPISSNMFDAAQPWAGKRPYWPVQVRDLDRDVTTYAWKRLVSDSRKLFANLGPAQGAIVDKAMYAVGRQWLPVFVGIDKAWGDKATEWLVNEWYPICNVRGSMYNFQTDLFLESVAADRDGDFGIYLTEFDGGYPAIQSIPAHRIGSPEAVRDDRVIEGAYAGLRIENGVVYNVVGRPVAYHVLADDPADNQYVSARDLIHVFDPLWFDQGRGLPGFTHALLDLRDMMATQGFEKQALMLASSIGLLEYNEEGGPDQSDPSVALSVSQQTGNIPAIYTEMLDGGATRYFRANGGGKLESFQFDRPAASWHNLQDRLLRNSFAGLSWPYELAWDSSKIGGANVRLVTAKARRTIEDRQDLLRRPARIKVRYAVSKAVNLGILPPSDDWWKWEFTLPPSISVDNGRDAQQTREDYKLGLVNMGELQATLNGRTEEQHWRQRAYSVVLRKKIQAEVEAETGVHIDDRDMTMLSPNEQPDGAVGKGDDRTDPEDEPPPENPDATPADQ